MTIYEEDSDDAFLNDEEQCCKESPPPNDIVYSSKDNNAQKTVLSDAEQGNDDEREGVNKDVDRSTNLFKTFTIEPFMTMFMFSFITTSVCNQNLLIDKSCLFVFNQPYNVCNNLDNYTHEKKQIETYASNYNLYVMLIRTVPAVFFSMVIGPWSDKYGRKLPIIIALIGEIVENIGIILNVIYFDAPMYFLLISGIPSGITGGMISVVLCVYSLASEQTSPKQRTAKYAFIELAFGIGTPLGTFVGGLIYKEYGYLYVYIISLSVQVVSLPWVIFIIKETRTTEKRIIWNLIKDLFCFDNFKESIHTISKPRENNIRKEIWLLIASMCTLITTMIATSGFGYYFAKWMYNFEVTTYSNINTIFISCGMALSVLVVVISARVLKLKNSDGVYGLIGSISGFSTNIIKAVAIKTWLYYLACSCGVLQGLGMLAVRSRLSKIVKGDELGKIFAFLSSCESLTPVLASVVFTQIFNASIDFFPGLAYLVAGILTAFPVAVFFWIIRRRKHQYQLLPSQ